MPDLYFDTRKMGVPQKNFVAFFDIMGMQSHLNASNHISANFMFKFHAAALCAQRDSAGDIYIYPIMDGMYATTAEALAMKHFTSLLFSSLAKVFMDEPASKHLFIPRGAISYGEVFHGREIPDDASKVFSEYKDYKKRLLIGSPMIKAYQLERAASPFGVFIDDCASCSLCETGARFTKAWKWFDENGPNERCAVPPQDLSEKLRHYFEDLARRATTDEEARNHSRHLRLISNYFRADGD